jgi:hypothetical protein
MELQRQLGRLSPVIQFSVYGLPYRNCVLRIPKRTSVNPKTGETTNSNKKFWEERIAYFPLIQYGSHRKRPVQQFFYCYVCIRDAVTFLPNRYLTTIEGYTLRHRLIGGTYEVRHSDGLNCHDIHTKFQKYWFRHSEVDSGNSQTDIERAR